MLQISKFRALKFAKKFNRVHTLLLFCSELIINKLIDGVLWGDKNGERNCYIVKLLGKKINFKFAILKL